MITSAAADWHDNSTSREGRRTRVALEDFCATERVLSQRGCPPQPRWRYVLEVDAKAAPDLQVAGKLVARGFDNGEVCRCIVADLDPDPSAEFGK